MFCVKLISLFLISILLLQTFASPYKRWYDDSSSSEEDSELSEDTTTTPPRRSKLIYSVRDDEFKPYGRIVEGYSVKEILKTLKKKTPLPDGVEYLAEDENLMALDETKELATSLYGGMPYQFGYCNGHNTKMNCLEYHKDSEYNVGVEDFVLILAKITDIEDGKIDSSKAKAFRVPKGVLVEVYGSTLHYAPCHTDPTKGFKVLIALPKGTNVGTTQTAGKRFEDKTLFATNKWLFAHEEASEVKDGAYVGITGENIDIADLI